MTQPIAIIGGGLTGLTCAIRLAEQGKAVHLYESAPTLGGRTKSHYDDRVDEWVDNGPHLLIGAYRATRQLMQDVGAENNMTWQTSLHLPLFDAERGRFSLAPKAWLPFPVALLAAIHQMPSHGLSSIKSMLGLAWYMKKPSVATTGATVEAWLTELAIEPALIRDMIEPLCIGAMNEAMDRADLLTFVRVLNETFANHDSARLGWFNQPLTQGLIEPLEQRLRELGGQIFTSTPVRRINVKNGESCSMQLSGGTSDVYSAAVIALPAHARDRLLGIDSVAATSPITNVHLWFDRAVQLPDPLLGSINSYSQWFFDVTAQTGSTGNRYSHICAVISADAPDARAQLLETTLTELAVVLGEKPPKLFHHKIICEQRATVLTRSENRDYSSGILLDASEAPKPGDLPATIEAAVIRGETAANTLVFNKNGRLSTVTGKTGNFSTLNHLS